MFINCCVLIFVPTSATAYLHTCNNKVWSYLEKLFQEKKTSNLRGLRMSHNPTPSLELAVAMSLGSTGLNITLWKADG